MESIFGGLPFWHYIIILIFSCSVLIFFQLKIIPWFKRGFPNKFFISQAWKGAIRVFIVYWVTAIIFAFIYCILYELNYENFVFNADIALAKNKELQIEAIAYLKNDANNAHVGKVDSNTVHVLALSIGSDTVYISDTNQITMKAHDFLRMEQKNRLFLPWTYLDFLYFSAGSLTGGAFGDIIPNSTIVRVLCTLQTIIGYFLIVVLLNISLVQSPLEQKSKRARLRYKKEFLRDRFTHNLLITKLYCYLLKRRNM
jgi:hypothetical protein